MLVCPDALIPILATSRRSRSNRAASYGRHTTIVTVTGSTSLPAIFKTTLETIPADIPYLHADTRLVQTWHERLSGVTGYRVGVVWAGTARYLSDLTHPIRSATWRLPCAHSWESASSPFKWGGVSTSSKRSTSRSLTSATR